MGDFMMTFDELLRKYRRNATDPDFGGKLTQKRVAELLEFRANLPFYTNVRVGNWERGVEKINHENRELLVALIELLHFCSGISALAEANELLQAGGYRNLDDAEMATVNVAWLAEALEEKRPFIEAVPQPTANRPATASLPAASPPAVHTPFMVPSLPPQGIVGRADLLQSLAATLTQQPEEDAETAPLALQGMGGIGKTTLCMGLGRLPAVQSQFPDGVLWAVLGPKPTLRFPLENWGRALGVDLQPERDATGCRDRLRELLYHRRMLLLVDDVWAKKDGEMFLVAGPNGRTVFTTREPGIANFLATSQRTVPVDLLTPEAALALLARLAPQAVRLNFAVAKQLCWRLERLPLALTLAGRLLANETAVPSRLQRLLDELLERGAARLELMQAEGRLGIDEENPVSLQDILGLSVERLRAVDRERFALAGVLGGEPLTWSLDLAQRMWDCDRVAAEDTVARFVQRGLVTPVANGRYWMHALLVDYAEMLRDKMGM